MVVPQNRWFIREHPYLKWMMTRGTPIYENPSNINVGQKPLKNHRCLTWRSGIRIKVDPWHEKLDTPKKFWMIHITKKRYQYYN